MMDDPVAMEAVAARVGYKAPHGPGLLLAGPAEQVASGEALPAPPRDGDREAAVGGVKQRAEGVDPHGVGDLAVSGPVLPGDQPPASNQRAARVHRVHGGLPGESAQILACEAERRARGAGRGTRRHSACHSTRRYSARPERTGWTTTRPELQGQHAPLPTGRSAPDRKMTTCVGRPAATRAALTS